VLSKIFRLDECSSLIGHVKPKKQSRPTIWKVKEICKRTNHTEDWNKFGVNDALNERLNNNDSDCERMSEDYSKDDNNRIPKMLMKNRTRSPALQTRRKKVKERT